MWNSIGSWFCIMGLIIGPFSIGVVFEEKLQRANRELGSRLCAGTRRLSLPLYTAEKSLGSVRAKDRV